MDYTEYITSRETIERIDVEIPMEHSKDLLNALYRDGWSTTRSGPKRVDLMKVDPSIYHVEAEREAQ